MKERIHTSKYLEEPLGTTIKLVQKNTLLFITIHELKLLKQRQLMMILNQWEDNSNV